jgi:predicted phosphohydrolase
MADCGKTFLQGPWDEYDICIIAGDLASAPYLSQAIENCKQTFKNIIYIMGNHECYSSSIKRVREFLKTVESDTFHVLDNSTCTIDGQRFVGGTMWFRPDPQPRYRREMNDFRKIKHAKKEIFEENERFLQFMKKVNVTVDDIVITHHLPSYRSVHPMFTGSALNPYFVCEMDGFIQESQPKLWIHGHTHTSSDYTLGVTRVYCNPYGYLSYDENPRFQLSAIEV